jgi:O-antigen ligase
MRLNFLQLLPWLVAGIYLTFTTAYGLSNILLALVLLVFVLIWERKFWARAHWNVPSILLLALMVMVLVGLAYTTATWQWASINLGKYSKLALVVPLMLLLHDRPVWQQRAMNAFGLGMTFILASTWLNIWLVLPWSASKTPGWGVSHHVMYDYIIQNVMMSFYVVYALLQADKHKQAHWRAIWLVLAAGAIFSITHLSQGRTGVVVLVPALLAYGAARWGARKTLIALPLTAIVLGATAMSSSVMRERIEQAYTEFSNRDTDVFSSIGHRLYNWKTTSKLIAEAPVIGHGTGAYHTEICRVLDKPEWCNIFHWHSHNQYLFFAADHGLIGAGLYIALIASLFVVAYKSPHPTARTLLFTLASILAVDSLFNSPMFSSKEAEFFLYMMALLVPMCRQLDSTAKESG